MGNLQATISKTSLGGDGEDISVSAQHTLEVESAHALPVTSQILHSLHAQTFDVSQVIPREMEVSKSTANEETLGSSTRVTEAQMVSSEVVPLLTSNDAPAEAAAELGAGLDSGNQDQSISDQIVNIWDDDELPEGNLEDFEFDEDLLRENQSDSEPTLNLVDEPMPPPLLEQQQQQQQQQQNIIDLDPPYQRPPISH